MVACTHSTSAGRFDVSGAHACQLPIGAVQCSTMSALKSPPLHKLGRPRKYGRPSRAVTFTLPEDVLERLGRIDADLGRAIVTLIERQPKRAPGRAIAPAEISSYGNHAVIVVSPANVLKRLPGVQLVPVGNGRALISLAPSNSIAQLELAVRDAVENKESSSAERATLKAIADVLQGARRSHGVSLEQRTIIVLEGRRQRRTVGGN